MGSLGSMFSTFAGSTGFANLTLGHAVMLAAALLCLHLGVRRNYLPRLLLPIGFGMLVANVPTPPGAELLSSSFLNGTSGPTTIMDYLHAGLLRGYYVPLIFLGVGAVADFSSLLANPRLLLLGAAAQLGIFTALGGALFLGFTPQEAASVGVIGGADGPTALFLASRLAPHLIAPITLACFAYIALVPVLQPPLMRLLTTREERLIRMRPARNVSREERILFPVGAFLVCSMIAPRAAILLGMLFLGNLLKESGVTDRLSNTAKTAFLDVVTILVGLSVGVGASAENMLKPETLAIFGVGAASFAVATAAGILFAKLLNRFAVEKINPLVGAAGVSALPDAARLVQRMGAEEDPTNYLLTHATGPSLAGLVGSAVAAGVLWSLLGG